VEFHDAFPQTNAVLEAILHRASSNCLQVSAEEIVSRVSCAKALLEIQPDMDEVAAAQLQQLLMRDSLAKWSQQLQSVREQQVHVEPPPIVLAVAQKRLSSKKRSNLNSAARALLVQWLKENSRSPYPSEEEKAQLAADANVSKEQITNFFINARGRSMWKDIAEQQGLTISRDPETNKWYAE